MLRTSIKKYGQQLAAESKREGIQKGIRKKAVETARILLFKKMPLNEIAEITGLTAEEIKKLDK